MIIDFLLNEFKQSSDMDAIIWKDKIYTYQWLLDEIIYWIKEFNYKCINNGKVVAVQGDFSPRSIVTLLSLMANNCIIVPQNYTNRINIQEKYDIAKVQTIISIDEKDILSINAIENEPSHEYILRIIKNKAPGLILFSSGTTGKPKAAVHDFSKLMEKFKTKRKPLKFINFLLFDHWGGLNTMFHTLSNSGVVITVQKRSPECICKMIQDFRIEVLPSSPSFLNLLLLSGAYKHYDMSSLKIISYGTEPMPANTLEALNKLFPGVKLLQTYGLIEVGVLRSKSKDNDSLWLKVGGEGYETRVINGILQIKADSAMLGYLNAPSPFTKDGWFNTGDFVEEDGEYIKIIGRKSELINVGGEKVYPVEVESIIQELDCVMEVEVYGEKNPIIGNIVCAKVRIHNNTETKNIIEKIKAHCRSELESFKVPMKVKLMDKSLHSSRFKKVRTHS
tara:strand:+ start:1437 stop:2783 length:1347 start_codon:yes stop_codon:yes gene_type:complete